MEDKNISVPLGGERTRTGGAGCAVCMTVCKNRARMQEFLSFVCLCTSETSFWVKTSRRDVTKGAKSRASTSASPDALLWSRKYLPSASPLASFTLQLFFLRLLCQNYTAAVHEKKKHTSATTTNKNMNQLWLSNQTLSFFPRISTDCKTNTFSWPVLTTNERLNWASLH